MKVSKINAMELHIPLRLPQTFAALRHPNYRLWFIGQLVSLVGTWMQSTAQGYLVYTLTGSPAYLGYVSFAGGIPIWLFTLYGGVIADRMPRRNLLVITQTTMLVLAFILAGLVFIGVVQPWHIVLMAFLLGLANAFDAPTRQAFVMELTGGEDLTNAIALNATMFNTATMVGPAVAGFTYAWLGPGWCFTFNGLSFIAVIIALLLMRLPPFIPPERQESAITQLKEGVQYVASHDTIRMFITNLGFISAFGFGVVALIPAWAVEVLGGDVRTNGLLLSSRGTGALIGALMIAYLGRRRIKGKLWTIGSFSLPITLLIFTLVRWLPLSLLLACGLGWSFMMLVNTANALVQTQVDNGLRGRVMGIYMLTFQGLMPIGSLVIGLLASRLNEPIAVAMSGFVLIVMAIWVFIRKPNLRKLE